MGVVNMDVRYFLLPAKSIKVVSEELNRQDRLSN